MSWNQPLKFLLPVFIPLALAVNPLLAGVEQSANDRFSESGLKIDPPHHATSHGNRTSISAITNNEDSQSIDQNWWKNIQRNLAEYEYHPSENGKGLQAPNRAHNLRTYFDSTGIRVHDRTEAAGSPELAGLSLVRIGRGDALVPVSEGKLSHAGTRVEIRRDRIIEWYENSAKGLEQGFTLEQQPPGEGPLVLELAIVGAQATLDNQSVRLTTNQGRRLRYGKLIAKDAAENTLNSRMEVPSPQHIRLVIQDTGANYPLIIDPLLTGVPDTILESNQEDPTGFNLSVFGGSVASAGDVNGDGFSDVIVGATGWDGGESEEGAAFVFHGSAAGIVGNDPLTAHARIESNQINARLGTVTGAGDVNGDGFDDILIGAFNYSDTLPGTALEVNGAAFVFHGSVEGITGTDPTTADAWIKANELSSDLGLYISGAGDVNNDTFADIIIGVPSHGTPFPPGIPPNDRSGNIGAALVFHGSSAGITGTGFSDADTVILSYEDTGLPQPTRYGNVGNVSGAGDVNGDGFDDIVLGGSEISLFLGSATGIEGTDLSMAHQRITGDPPITITDSIGGAGAGFAVAGAGDVNGDNFPDVIASLGASHLNPIGINDLNGGVFVFLGTSTGYESSTGTVASAHATFFGNSLASLAQSIAGIGDVDGDGFDDIALGGGSYPGGLTAEGVAYVFRGSSTGIIGDTLLDAYLRLETGQSGAMGTQVAGAGDVNGDGFADVIRGAWRYDVDQENEGAAFIYYGQPAPVNQNQPPVALAGPDQVVIDMDNSGSATFRLDGSASFDLDGFIVDYAWLKGETLLGTSPVLTTALPTTGDHVLALTVTDDAGISRGDAVTVRVEPTADVQVLFDGFTAGFGFAPWVTGGDVTLSSVDTFPDPPQVRIGATGSFLSTTLDMPAGSTGMTVSFQGKASQFSAEDELLVKVSVDGGPFTTIHTITFADSNDNYVFYGGSAIPIGHSWFPATASNIVLEFESKMGTGLFFVDLVRVMSLSVPPGTPLPPPGELPVANAGGDIIVDDNDSDGFELVFLDGTQSTDADGIIVSYEWFRVTNLEGMILLGTGSNLGVSFARGDHIVRLIVTDNDGGSASSEAIVVTVNQSLAINQAPVANAGADLSITDLNGDTLEFVNLDGRASTDVDGSIVDYIWTENGNVLSSVVGGVPEGQLRIILPIGVHNIELTVVDNQGASSSPDSVVVTVVPVTPDPPIDSFLATPTSITAGASSTLSWTTTGADTVVINGGPNLPLDGSLVVSPTTSTLYILTAIGPAGASQAMLTVTVDPQAPPPNQAPSANAGADQSVEDGDGNGSETVTLDGSASTDTDGTITSYAWLDGVTSIASGVNPPVTLGVGTHNLTLTVTDDVGASSTDTVVITVNPQVPPPNQTPTANAGADQSVEDGDGNGSETVTLDGSASSDTDGTITSYAWLDGVTSIASGVNPSVTLAVGTHNLTLTVTDDAGATSSDTVVIQVQAVSPGASDFSTQVVKLTIPAGSNSVLSSAFDAVDSSRTVALISGVTQHAMGWTAETTQDPVEISATVDLSVDGNTLTATRASAMNQTDTVWVLLIEYRGPVGGANELLVRDRRIHNWSAGQASSSYGPINTTLDASRTVVFATGSSNSNTASSGYDRGDVRAWLDGNNIVQLVRGDGGGAISSAHQVVEFVGGNWSIQSGDTAPGQDPGGTSVLINSVNSVNNAWVYFTWSSNSANLDERGHRVWLSSATNLQVQEDAAATGSKTIRWSVISNPQMQVQTGEANNQMSASNAGSISGFAPVSDLTHSFAWVTGMTNGGGNAHPRDMWQFELQDSSTINLQRGRTGQDLSYRYFVVELPTDTGTGGGNQLPVANAGVDQSAIDSNGDLEESFLLDASASSDPDGTITSYEWHEGINLLTTGVNPIVSLSVGTHTIDLTVTDDGGATATDVVVITVDPQVPPPPPPTPSVDSFSATPSTITAGGSTTLDWTTTDADSVSINGGASLAADGSSTVSPTSTTTYTLVATGAGGTASANVTVTVNPAPPGPPSVDSFAATPTTITAGGSATLAWTTSDADSVSINGGANLAADGTSTVSPTATTTYTLVATGAGGTASASVTVTVNPAPPGPPSVDSFSAAPTAITAGGSATLDWTTTDADSVSINGGASLAADGTSTVSPTATTTYTLTATGAGGTASASVTVTVNPAPPGPPSVDSFSATPTTITAGGSATLAWTTTDADSVSINGGASLAADGTSTVSPTATTTYTLVATGAGGTASASVTVTVNPAPPGPPSVDSFSAVPTTITAGGSTTLAWTTTDADSVSINGGANLAADGTSTVSPTATTTYTLVATGAGGTASASVTVTVNPAPPGPPSVDSFSAAPTAITAGGSATLAWTTTDADSVSINGGANLATDGTSTVSPTAATTYTLVATGAGGTATASVIVTVNDVTLPQGSVSISGPASIERGDRTSFTVTLTNTGSSTITAVQLSFSVTPNSLLKDVSPGSSVAVGNVPAGGSVSQTWNVRGDNEGSGTITAGASSGGTTLDTVTRSLVVTR